MAGRIVRGFTASAFVGDHERLTLEYLSDQERLGCVRPDWRFAWLDEQGEILARVAYWAPPGATRPILLDVLLVKAGNDGTAAELLRSSMTDRWRPPAMSSWCR